jgi:deoxyribodipyrimidine photolyase-related protein
MKKAVLIFPHQLFENTDWIDKSAKVFLIEETLFFSQYPFHKQKILFHRSSMQFYFNYLVTNGFDVEYVNNYDDISDVRLLIKHLVSSEYNNFEMINPDDNYLLNRINQLVDKHNVSIEIFDNPQFLNTILELDSFFKNKEKKFFQTSFYITQRKKMKILLNEDDKPVGDKWSFDTDNRKTYPKGKIAPKINFPTKDTNYKEAKKYVNKYYENNYGNINEQINYPCTHSSAKKWLEQFIKFRFKEFGDYEDAVMVDETFLNHSVLSPLLNVGLITPNEVISEVLKHKNEIPLNSLEGFVRQIIGWREFIRGVYHYKGVQQRNSNFFDFTRKIPKSFYDGSTGVFPFDNCVKKVLQNAYSNHIERLMILGNFMLLCEINPNDIYKWFMELYIDSYDWVMVPNIYGMSQFSDGGLMSSKPYISSSNYIKKMSDYKNGPWSKIWDALYWRFIDKHRQKLAKNIRMKFMINLFDKMDDEKKNLHISTANTFLKSLI